MICEYQLNESADASSSDDGVFVDKPKLGNKQQRKFEKMIGMEYSCPGIGDVQLMVDVRKRDKMKIQYCITALTPIISSSKKSSHK